MASFVDHYAALGVKSTGNLTSINKAYRQLALQHHHDKAEPGGKVDAAKFISAQAAYEILVVVTRRTAYDMMKGPLSGLEQVVIKLEGWPDEELDKVEGYLSSFMHEYRDWEKEITSPP